MSDVADQTTQQIAEGFAAARAILKPRKARPFFGRHPWVLDSAIERIEGAAADGDVVDLVTDSGKFIARGLLNTRGRIRVRLYTWDVRQALDRNLFEQRILKAIELRRQLGYDAPDAAARLVFSEADGLSGLIVDRYADFLSVQVTALGMALRLDEMIAMLVEHLHPRGILVRTEKGVAAAEGIDLRDGLAWGQMPDGPVFIRDNDLRFGVDLAVGQKTGFYLDQRENRAGAARYMADRSVLDAFCYSGGFGLTAAARGAKEVLGIDSSEKAIALARANAELNGITNVKFEERDCFAALDELSATGRHFDAVVLDPPKFARSRQAVEEAMRAYHRLNRLAVDVLEPHGILVTCSCSGHVTREDFLYMLVGVAQQTKRDIQILEQRGASPDHPVSATCLETEYLKCFICRVS